MYKTHHGEHDMRETLLFVDYYDNVFLNTNCSN